MSIIFLRIWLFMFLMWEENTSKICFRHSDRLCLQCSDFHAKIWLLCTLTLNYNFIMCIVSIQLQLCCQILNASLIDPAKISPWSWFISTQFDRKSKRIQPQLQCKSNIELIILTECSNQGRWLRKFLLYLEK